MFISAQSIESTLNGILEKIQSGDNTGAITAIESLDEDLTEASRPMTRKDKMGSRSAQPKQYSPDLPLYEGVREQLRMITAQLKSGKRAVAVETTRSAIEKCSTLGA